MVNVINTKMQNIIDFDILHLWNISLDANKKINLMQIF